MRHPNWWKFYCLGCFSGVLSWISFLQGPLAGPGLVFGLVVVLPYALMEGLSWWRSGLAIALSPVAYRVAISFQVLPVGAGWVCGSVGAVITFGPLFIRPNRRSLGVYCRLILTGGVTGAIGVGFLGWQFFADDFLLKVWGVLSLWQMGTATVLGFATGMDTELDSRNAPLAAGQVSG